MPDLRSLTRQKPTAATIDLGDGDTVALVFDRNAITPAWRAEAERRDQADDALSLPKALADAILEWDVTHDGEPFPPTAENLAVLSYVAQSELLLQIVRAALPSDAEGKGSSEPLHMEPLGSTPPPATSPNGPATFDSLEPSASQSST